MLDEIVDGFRIVMKAHADIEGKEISGSADFTEYEDGVQKLVKVIVEVKGDPGVLKPGFHGVHIHENAVCEGDFTSAGGHFDPGPYGFTDPDENHPFHMGDLPNIEIIGDGSGILEAITSRITLSDGPLSLFSPDAVSIILHDMHDAGKPGASGSGISGGKRLACGVIQKV